MLVKRFKRMADDIARRLVAEGFTVHRYDAEKTDSVYLKLDWGACNGIRISDHPGLQHAKYRYNIGTWITVPMEVEDRLLRFFWPVDHIAEMVERIKADKAARIGWVGESGYAMAVERKKREARRARSGFWAHARKVKKGMNGNETFISVIEAFDEPELRARHDGERAEAMGEV